MNLSQKQLKTLKGLGFNKSDLKNFNSDELKELKSYLDTILECEKNLGYKDPIDNDEVVKYD